MKTIYDVGMYDASDTKYFLEEGYRVIAVEANPSLVASARQGLASYLQSGQLHIVQGAVGSSEAPVEFTISGDDLGSSSVFEKHVAARVPLGKYTVPGIIMDKLFATYGVPFYLKIDIEGADGICVRALKPETKPSYLSFEVGDDLEDLLSHAAAIGFTKFKLIDQKYFRELSNQNHFGDRLARKLMRSYGFAEPQGVKFGQRWFVSGHSSGPAPWCSDGAWSSLDQLRRKWQTAKAANRLRDWYDVHAA